MSDQPVGGSDEPEAPTTGLPSVDEALSRLDKLAERPVSEHHDVLAGAHEVLHTELQPPSDRG